MEIIQGVISAVVYQNYDNGYAVLRLNVGGGQGVTVVGTIPLPAVGERLMVTGKWNTEPIRPFFSFAVNVCKLKEIPAALVPVLYVPYSTVSAISM